MERTATRIKTLAKERLGFDALRPGQEEAAVAAAERRDTMVIMPTGGGKSAIYQLAALMLDGPTIVVSPLISLQYDQLRAMLARDLPPAALINSTLKKAERDEALDALRNGELEFCFLAPEQFENDEVHAALLEAQPSLVVIDEAHCVSEWGHDFRPEYGNLGNYVEPFDAVKLALTATASGVVRREIIKKLKMDEPLVVSAGFDRPNLHLDVERFTDNDAKWESAAIQTNEQTGSGIVYCATRKHCEVFAECLGDDVAVYHGGLKDDERAAAHHAFMKGEARVVVATNAFGMGIDKPDIDFVVHLDVPASIDEYYQQIGRAGRDGRAALTKLFYRTEDFGVARFHAGGSDEKRHEFETSRIEMMQRYAETSSCRRETLLSYFGQDYEGPCGNCDVDEQHPDQPHDNADEPFPVGTRVAHGEWGTGEVLAYEGDTMTVLFDDEGYKTLSVTLVRANALLRSA